MKCKHSIIAMALLGTLSWNAYANPSQQLVDNIANNVVIKYELVTNDGAGAGVDCQALGADWASCNLSKLHLTNNGAAIPAGGWEIYLHSIRRILRVDNDHFRITHLTGDLYRLEPSNGFKGLASGGKLEIPLVVEYWQLFETDVMPNWYVVAPGAAPRVLASMSDVDNPRTYTLPFDGDKWKRTKDDANILMTSQTRFEANAATATLPAADLAARIIPAPLQQEVMPGLADLSRVQLQVTGLPKEQIAAVRQALARLGVKEAADGYPVRVSVGHSQQQQAEGYELHIAADGATIKGHDAAGALWGMQSLLSLLGVNQHQVPLMQVSDAPRFEYRGMQTDVARHFRSKQTLMKLIDQMSAMKLNKLHLGLTNDEGWRLEIPGLPELTDVGGKRCHDLTETRCLLPQLGSGPDSDNQGSGFYSRQDYIELVRYAAARGVTVIPEINMPAHARAAVMSMEARYQRLKGQGKLKAAEEYRLFDSQDASNSTSVQFYDKHSYINPCLPSTVRFVDKVMSEVAKMHQQAGQPLTAWHYGGDETKNIFLGAGFQDTHTAAKDKVAWKGNVDLSKQDYAFAKSPACQRFVAEGKVKAVQELPSWFAREVSQQVKQHGMTALQAWQDGLKYANSAADFATPQTVVNFWDTLYWGGFNEASAWAEKGYQVVLSNPDYLYFDFPWEVNPQERGYYWATRFNDTRKVFAFAPENLPQNAETSVDRDGKPFVAKGEHAAVKFKGMSGQQWSETVQTDEQYEYMVYPRIFSLAERAWHQAGWELPYVKGREFSDKSQFVDKVALAKDWQLFANVLGQREMAKLEAAGVHYRLSVPGGKIVGGKLEANTDLPGLRIEFSTDGQQWQAYDASNQPAVTAGKVWLRSVSFDGQRHSRVTTL
ncbi:beta-N-acetylhexosaminidase [Pseudaeromonas sharmana]|uniref:beta-N-acetylhexosaminidase n=1 Tax=Pseudaeromonas sharmana TaxID=328412 RepID=A0ABV8CR21_9GAMM